jgi:hypothetical protein
VQRARELGMEGFWKLYMAELKTGVKPHIQDDSPDSQVEDDDLSLTGFPKNPRFGATLSIEAKFAQLQCYEDKIVDKLSSQFPDNAAKLNRNKTPNKLDAISSDGDDEHVVSLLGHKEYCNVALRKVTQSMNSAMAIMDDLTEHHQADNLPDRTAKSYNDWSKSWVTDFDL